MATFGEFSDEFSSEFSTGRRKLVNPQSIHIREPRLLVPGKQPRCLVKIDTANRNAKNPVVCFRLRKDLLYLRDLKQEYVLPYDIGDTPSWVSDRNGIAVEMKAGETFLGKGGTYPKVGANDFTISFVTAVHGSTAVKEIARWGYTGVTAGRWYVGIQGTPYIEIFPVGGSIVKHQASVSNYTNWEQHSVVVTRNGTTGEINFYDNGLRVATFSGETGDCSAAQSTKFLQMMLATSAGYCRLYHFAAWNRLVVDPKGLSADPYQVYLPA